MNYRFASSVSVFRRNSLNHHSLKGLVYEALFLALRINSEQNRQDHILMELSSEDRQTVNKCERKNSNDKTQTKGWCSFIPSVQGRPFGYDNHGAQT